MSIVEEPANARRTIRFQLNGEEIQAFVDRPGGPLRGVAVICHPQPLLGGTARHPIPHHLANVAVQSGWLAIRPNFRGVGGSSGLHDAGKAEADDALAIATAVLGMYPDLPIVLAGFSFGAFVQAQVIARLPDSATPRTHPFLIGLPVGTIKAGRHYDTSPIRKDTVLVHGEYDDVATLSALLDHVRESSIPVNVIPGADHYFRKQMITLERLFSEHLDRTLRKHALAAL